MKGIKKCCLWCLLLTKRLYKKPTFLVLMLIIPLLVVCYGTVAQEDSGVVTIALAQENSSDPMGEKVLTSLADSSQLVHFLLCDTPSQAENLVTSGEADGAWIFMNNLEQRMYAFINKPVRSNAFIRIVERESSVVMLLTREKLTGTVFAYASPLFYLNYIRQNIPELSHVSDEDLLTHYDAIIHDNKLFAFAYLDSAQSGEDIPQTSYLLSPVRGLLAIVVTLCALATAMYYTEDCRRGMFAWVPQRKKPLVELGCQSISIVNISLVVLLSLSMVGLTVNWLLEILIFLLFVPCTALFAMTVRRLCRSLPFLGMCLPLLAVVMLVVCPVLFDLSDLAALQYLFPPTYYINAPYSNRYLWAMPIYTAVLYCLYTAAGKLLHGKYE